MAACACAAALAGNAEPADAGQEWHMTVTMDEVVHVDEPFTLNVWLWNPSPDRAQLLIRHHREDEYPFEARFRYVSGNREVYEARLVRGDDKTPYVVQTWDVRCGPEVPASERVGTFCPPTENVYDVPGDGRLVFEESVRLRDYAGVLDEFSEGFSRFIDGPHLLDVAVSFVAKPTRDRVDAGNDTSLPLIRLEKTSAFVLETGSGP